MAARSSEDVESDPVIVHVDETYVRGKQSMTALELAFELDELRRAID